MSEISPPTFTNGQLDIASDLYNTFYSSSVDSLRVINGDLNGDNFTIAPVVTYKNIQRNTFSGGGHVAGTANLDFFSGGSGTPKGSGWFRNAAATNQLRAIAVPGACLKFYLPYDALVLLTWSITWTNDSDDLQKTSNVMLFVDGDIPGTGTADNTAFARRVRRTMFGGANAITDDGSRSTIVSDTNDSLQDRFKSRTWSGHYFTPVALSAGWHDAGLRICASSGVKQTRVRARSMKYVYFKYGATK
jgi:hypothetical protein|tara:strand:+ start:223 stop:963 length:741 start_codon:yes stop_codon:yes gene_type:complete